MPLIDADKYRRTTAATISGPWMAEQPLRECRQWVRSRVPADFWKPVGSRSVPALVMVGELDAVTPVAYAERLVSRFDRGTLVRLPWRSHGDSDACVFNGSRQEDTRRWPANWSRRGQKIVRVR